MQKIIREVDEKRGIFQVTIADERWYLKSVENPETKIPYWKSVPSVTWIAGHYPKGIGFYKWLADKGWDEAEGIKSAAGDKGSKVHAAISAIIGGYEVRIDSKFKNPSTDRDEELTLDEIICIDSFKRWFQAVNPISLAWDVTVFSDKHNYAGTIDYICKIGEEVYIIDFKTSQAVWAEMEMQVSAYKQAVNNGENDILIEGKPIKVDKLAILQIGYKRNKDGFKWNDIEDAFDLFLNAQAIWRRETKGQDMKKLDFPIVLSAGKPREEDVVVVKSPKEVDMKNAKVKVVISKPKTI